jgi:hypothetical protein
MLRFISYSDGSKFLNWGIIPVIVNTSEQHILVCSNIWNRIWLVYFSVKLQNIYIEMILESIYLVKIFEQ